MEVKKISKMLHFCSTKNATFPNFNIAYRNQISQYMKQKACITVKSLSLSRIYLYRTLS